MINEKLERLKEHFGSFTKLAEALNVSPQAINDWRVKGRIPAGAAVEIERLTNGEFKALELVE